MIRLLLIGLIAIGTGVAVSLQEEPPHSLLIPTIKPDPAPIRSRPVDPGGMDIPFQDSTVYTLVQRR